MRKRSEWVPARFTVDEGETIILGEHVPSVRWNGWACPRFPKSEILRALEALAAVEYNDLSFRMDGEDIIVTEYIGHKDVNDGKGAEERHEPDADGYYHVGTFGWCWQDCTDWRDREDDEED